MATCCFCPFLKTSISPLICYYKIFWCLLRHLSHYDLTVRYIKKFRKVKYIHNNSLKIHLLELFLQQVVIKVKPWKKNSQKFAQYIAVKKSWISEKDKFLENSPFFVKLCPIFTIFLRRYIQRIFVKLFFMVHLHYMNGHKKFHIYRLKPIGKNIREIRTKKGKLSKKLTFSDFHDFFTAIYWADFCEFFFSWFTYTI